MIVKTPGSQMGSPAAVCCCGRLLTCRRVLQCVAVCCSVLQCVAVCCSVLSWEALNVLQCVAVCFGVLS